MFFQAVYVRMGSNFGRLVLSEVTIHFSALGGLELALPNGCMNFDRNGERDDVV